MSGSDLSLIAIILALISYEDYMKREKEKKKRKRKREKGKK